MWHLYLVKVSLCGLFMFSFVNDLTKIGSSYIQSAIQKVNIVGQLEEWSCTIYFIVISTDTQDFALLLNFFQWCDSMWSVVDQILHCL